MGNCWGSAQEHHEENLRGALQTTEATATTTSATGSSITTQTTSTTATAEIVKDTEPQQEVQEETSFRILSHEELEIAVGGTLPPDAGEGDVTVIATNGEEGIKKGAREEKEEEEWDCQFTDLAVITNPPHQPDGDPLQVNEYIFEKHLGSGSFGSVKLCHREVGEQPYKQYAMKVLSKHRLRRFKKSVMTGAEGRMVVKTGEDMVINEIEVMRHLYHRNVVLLFEVISDPSEDNIFMAMEYLEGGPAMTFDKDIKRFSSHLTGGGVLTSELAGKLFFGLVSGLQYLRSKNVCHRDIKPENLLLTDGTKLRISDFGCAVKFAEGEEEMLVDTAGTFTFLAPECCSGEPYSPWPADVWAAAVTLYCFVFGVLPFSKEGIGPLFEEIQEGAVAYPEDAAALPEPLDEVMKGIFIKDPLERWCVDRIRAHPWLDQARLEDEEKDKKIAEEKAGQGPE